MSLPQIFSWAVNAHLDGYKSTELVLLKGHLLLEVAVENAIHLRHEEEGKRSTDLSFHRKLMVLQSLQARPGLEMVQAIEHLHSLNRIRNRLAHEFGFVGGPEALAQWTKAVLSNLPGTKLHRHTPRTKLIQAFSSLAGAVMAPHVPLSGQQG